MTRLAAALLLLVLALPLEAAGTAADRVPAEKPAVTELARRLDELAVRLDAGEPGSDLGLLVTNYPLALLQLKKARLAAHSFYADPEEHATQGLQILDRMEQGRHPELRAGKLNELAYITDNDGSVQPYYLYLPPDWQPDPEKRWPLIVFLHGYVPSITVLDPWVLSQPELEIAGKLGAMVLIPYGRRNSDFQGVGEDDVLRALGYTIGLFGADSRRLYLTGPSMGGRGVWHIAAHHPGLFAAIAPLCGHTDMVSWWGWNRKTMPAYKQWLADRDGPLALAENLRGTPIYLQHGEEDNLIPVEQSRMMVRRLKELGLPVRYEEVPGASHYIYWDPETYRRAFEFLVQHTGPAPASASPARVTFKTYTPRYFMAPGLALGSFERWGEPAWADVTREAADRYEVRTGNLSGLRLDLASRLTAGSRLTVRYNGATRTVSASGWSVYLGDMARRLPAAGPEDWRRKGGPGVCGPLDDAFRTRFLVVPGTAGDAVEDARLWDEAEAWVDEWEEFADGRPSIVADLDLTEAQRTGCSLVLLGRPSTNYLLAQVASVLPLRIGDHAYQVGKRYYAGPSLGLAMCYPSPLSGGRTYLAIFTGQSWGRDLSPNHKFDLIPDYVVYDTSGQEYDESDQHLCAGFFDLNWQLDESLQSRTDPGSAPPPEPPQD